MVEKIGYFTFFILALDAYSGSPVEISADELPNIIIGMIEQLEREESERGQSEV